MARPRKVLDPKKIEAMASVGCTPEEIASLLDASPRTIRGRFCRPYQKGHDKLCHTIKRKLYQMTLDGNVAAMIFAAKVYCGLRENPDTVINVSATATGNQFVISEDGKKQLEKLADQIQSRMFARRTPTPSQDLVPSGNGNTTALN